MKKTFLGLLVFIAGCAVGFVAAGKLLKDRYEQIAQDEIDSVKAAFRKKREAPGPELETEQPAEPKKEYANRIRDLGYSEEPFKETVQKPRVISPEEFGDQGEYDEISLTLYSDGTVADDEDRPMGEDEIEETIGKDSLSHFGEYEDDSVFVRNDRLKADYEILMDNRTYGDILREKPYLAK